MNNGFRATFSKTRRNEMKEAERLAKTMREMAIVSFWLLGNS